MKQEKKLNNRKGTYETHQSSNKGKINWDSMIWDSDSEEVKKLKREKQTSER